MTRCLKWAAGWQGKSVQDWGHIWTMDLLGSGEL